MSGDVIVTYLQLGAIGATFLMLLAGVLTLGRETKRERELNDILTANLTKLTDATSKMAQAWEIQAARATTARTRRSDE